MEVKTIFFIAEKVFFEYLGISKYPKNKVILGSGDIVQMIGNGIERALKENTPTSGEQLAAPSVYLVIHKERLIIHGAFTSEAKANKYINDSDTFGVMRVELS